MGWKRTASWSSADSDFGANSSRPGGRANAPRHVRRQPGGPLLAGAAHCRSKNLKPSAEEASSRSSAQAAAKRKHSRMSAVSRSGYSARISPSVNPPASSRSTVATGIRRRRTQGTPPICAGSNRDAIEVLHRRSPAHCRSCRAFANPSLRPPTFHPRFRRSAHRRLRLRSRMPVTTSGKRDLVQMLAAQDPSLSNWTMPCDLRNQAAHGFHVEVATNRP